MTRPLQLFVHVAVKDAHYLERLKTHLALLLTSGQVMIQHHIYRPGEKSVEPWSQELMRTADMQMFLVSADFLPALQSFWPMIRREPGKEQSLIPIYCGYCSLDSTPFKDFMGCNQPETALDGLSEAERDQVWAKVAATARSEVQQLDPASSSAPIWPMSADRRQDFQWPQGLPQVLADTSLPLEEADLALTASAREELVQALLVAFPRRSDLEMLLSFKLDVELDTIADMQNQRAVMFQVVKWAASNGRLRELVKGARERMPGNLQLKEFARKYL